jgi:hypothetical protein
MWSLGSGENILGYTREHTLNSKGFIAKQFQKKKVMMPDAKGAIL